ncbi:fimbrial biogenesis outer membrane usher protein [Providencia heimbachae]|uniref:fimbria/pilus outer membrane usher protein n=1 Tax=Providencia heimbachae TaxID=333962 RepID=UPI0010BE5C14|nr:fimbria/pilus outer membrane usher protein [Providencia heimbachae]QCJ69383.1 fimbrial biogenesis outer membrane usher protein [Providencia heimbachae]
MKLSYFKKSLLSSLILLPFIGYGEDYFDPSLLDEQLGIDPNEVNLSHFSKDNSIPTGQYTMQVFVNQEPKGDFSLRFVQNKTDDVVPELTVEQLASFGVKIDAISKLRDLAPNAIITELSDYIENASLTTNLSTLSVNLSVPQVSMDHTAEGYISQELLDDGVPAFVTNYMITGNHSVNDLSSSGKQKNDNLFVSLYSGINVGAWRLRSNMSHTYNRQYSNGSSRNQTDTDFSNTALTRNLYGLRSELLVGEGSTGSDLFNSIPFRGVQLSSNDQMLPSSLRGFAPDIKGIAQSNAQITIRQNGYVVYQTYVPPGPFNIQDLATGSNSGALDVTIKEEDGSERTFTVAFASLPIMQRPGGWKYELATGRYNGGVTVGSKEADFVLASGIYGLPNNITAYGGVIAAKDYWSGITGVGLSIGSIGAISADVTHAEATLDQGDKYQAQAYRVRYSKNIATTNTSIDVSGTHYTSRDYYTFNNFNNHNYRYIDDIAPWTGIQERRQYSASISQPLNEYGNFYFTGSRYEYWDGEQDVTQVSAGYNNSFQGVSYGVNYSIDRTKNSDLWPENRQISVNINIPFNLFSNAPSVRNMNSTYSTSHDNNGKTVNQAGISGSLLDSKLTYGVSQSWGNQNQNSSGSLYTNYAGNKGTLSAGYNYSDNYNSVNAGVNGGLVVHSGGMVFGRSMGSSMAIIEAEGAEGTHLTIGHSEINAQSQAIYPYLSEYTKNTVGLDINTLPDNVTLAQTSKNIYPTSGAIVKVKFDTRIGYQVIINLTHNQGVIPFGAVATLIEDQSMEENTGLVGDEGQLYMSGLPDTGILRIQWGTQKKQSCETSFSGLNKIVPTDDNPIRTISLNCTQQ